MLEKLRQAFVGNPGVAFPIAQCLHHSIAEKFARARGDAGGWVMGKWGQKCVAGFITNHADTAEGDLSRRRNTGQRGSFHIHNGSLNRSMQQLLVRRVPQHIGGGQTIADICAQSPCLRQSGKFFGLRQYEGTVQSNVFPSRICFIQTECKSPPDRDQIAQFQARSKRACIANNQDMGNRHGIQRSLETCRRTLRPDAGPEE